MNRVCKKCGAEKELNADNFRPHSTHYHRPGFAHICKVCVTKQAATWTAANAERVKEQLAERRAKNPEETKRKTRQYNLQCIHGITLEDFDVMLAKSGGRCELCKEIFQFTPQIDHCHTTGKIRGLLCKTCNTGLGKFQDSVEQLQKAIQYLQKSSK